MNKINDVRLRLDIRFLSTTVPRGCVEKMSSLANNLSAHNMKMLIQSECRRGISMIKDTWVTTNKYVDEQIMNQSLLRNKHSKRVQ